MSAAVDRCRHAFDVPRPPLNPESDGLHAMSPAAAMTGSATGVAPGVAPGDDGVDVGVPGGGEGAPAGGDGLWSHPAIDASRASATRARRARTTTTLPTRGAPGRRPDLRAG